MIFVLIINFEMPTICFLSFLTDFYAHISLAYRMRYYLGSQSERSVHVLFEIIRGS